MTEHKRPHDATGEGLESEVERLYRLLGATTRRRVLIKGYEVDVQAVFSKGPFRFAAIIECKAYNRSKAVSDLDMRSFVAKVLAAREAGAADKGVFVTTSSYAKTAIATADQHGIQCLRLSDLYNQLVNFQPYLRDIVAAFEATDLSRWYVEQTVSDVEDYDSLTTASQSDALHRGAIHWVDLLFEDTREPRIALLGNFGTGKTSFCLKYRAVLAKRALDSSAARIPVLIDLRDFRSGLDIHQVVTNTLQRVPELDVDIRLCLELGRMGRFFFLLDGLDEMATRVDRSVVNESLREIDRLRTEGDNRYIVTCRTHFFQERIVDEFLVDYHVLYLTEWSEGELRDYLSKRFASEWQQRHTRILSNKQLAELSRTPLLLEILLAAGIPDDGEVNIYKLLSRYTDEWISKQSRRRGAVITSDQRRRFAETLAVRLYAADRSILHFAELYELAREFSGFRDASRIDHFDADARTCTFITRDSLGNYTFRHKAFLEYFTASAIATAVEGDDRTLLELKDLTPEVVEFILHRGIAEKGLACLDEWSKDFASVNLSRNALQLLIGLRRPLAPEVQQRYEASSTEWKDLERLVAGESGGEIEEFWERYGNRIRVLAQKLGRRFGVDSQVDADELANDAFMYLWNSVRSGRLKLETQGKLDQYLYTVMQNRLVDRLRSNRYMERQSVATVNELNIADEVHPNPEKALIDAETHQRLEQAIRELPEAHQQVIRLNIEQELSMSEIADKLSMSPNTVRQIRARAITRLRELLKLSHGG